MRIIKAKEFNLAQLKELKAADKVVVEQIIRQVRERGDSAVRDCTEKFDKVKLEDLRVPEEEIKKAYDKIDKELLSALQFAIPNLTDFATSQMKPFKDFEQHGNHDDHYLYEVFHLFCNMCEPIVPGNYMNRLS